MDVSIVILGIGLGLLVIPPPGPVALTLVEIGMHQGRRKGIEGGLGVALGDVAMLSAAAAIVIAGAALPGALSVALQVASVATLLLVGGLLILRPTAAAALAERVERPLPAMFSFTALTPSVLGVWVAVLNAVPFRDSASALVTFSVGIVVASLGWHLCLAVGASALGDRLTDRRQRQIMRAGGAIMIALAALGALR